MVALCPLIALWLWVSDAGVYRAAIGHLRLVWHLALGPGSVQAASRSHLLERLSLVSCPDLVGLRLRGRSRLALERLWLCALPLRSGDWARRICVYCDN